MSFRVIPEKKQKYFKIANGLFDKYDKMFIVQADNVQSNQMQQIRHSMRGKAALLMGKNVCPPPASLPPPGS